MTTNIETRLLHHNRGYNKKTRAYAPFILIYSQNFSTRLEARNHEKYLKSGSGKEFLKENYKRT